MFILVCSQVIPAGGSLDYTCNFELKSDLETVVLEIYKEGTKTLIDAEPTSVRALLKEFEESGYVDTTVCCHQVTSLAATESAVEGDFDQIQVYLFLFPTFFFKINVCPIPNFKNKFVSLR